MSHTYSRNIVHVVFSTKERRGTIPKEFQPKLWAYMAGICNKIGLRTYCIGGVEDHVHLLFQIPPAMALANAVMKIKANSSKWAHKDGQKLVWQEGYAAFSVSTSLTPAVERYIRNQEAHHKKMKFDEEFIALLKKHGVDYDPKHVLG